MGKTLSRLKRELGCLVLTSGLVKKNMDYFPTPDGEKWRLGFIEELLDVWQDSLLSVVHYLIKTEVDVQRARNNEHEDQV